jgi:hypothetical protein
MTEVSKLSFEKKKKEGGKAAIEVKIKSNNQRKRYRIVDTKTVLKLSELLKFSTNIEKNKISTHTKNTYDTI